MNAAIRQRRRLFALLPLALLWMAASSPALSQDFDARHSQAVTANPPGVTFLLKLAGRKTQYHQGEIIPLQAVFTSSRPGVYQLNTDPGNRNLYWLHDVFVVDRAGGIEDPLRVYYAPSLSLSYDGPGPQWQPLNAAPVSVPLDLNEWLHFDKPGIYRIYMTCSRLSAANAKNQYPFFYSSRQTVTSDVIQIEILPFDAAWSAQTLTASLPAFNTIAHDYREVPAREAAARTIRFLDTPEAAQAIINRYATLTENDSYNSRIYFEGRLGLFGSPYRALIIRQMQDKITDPNFPIGDFFLSDLAELQLLEAYTDPLPSPPADASGRKQWEAESGKRTNTQTAFYQQYLAHLQQSLPRKRGTALARSLYTLFDPSYEDASTPTRRKVLAHALIAAFSDLNPDEQDALLDDSDWPGIRRPAMLPHLRRLWAAAAYPENMDFGFNDLILRRLYELSPQEGRRLILLEASKTTPRVDIDVLGSLPDATLPQLDQTLAVNMKKTTDGDDEATTARLVARYATSAILPRVKAVYGNKGGEWACAFQSALLAYFLRTDPAYGAAQVKRALAKRHDTGCYQTLLSDVSTIYMCPQLQKIAVAALHDPDPAVVTDAAKALGAHGSPAAEAVLWGRLREWHQEWQGREEELMGGKLRGDSERPEVGLAQALATSPAWLISRAQLREIARLCVAPDALAQSQIQSVDEGNNIYIYADGISEDGKSDQWRLAQYTLSSREALRHKMTQYPHGTVFTLVVDGPSPDPQLTTSAIKNLQAFAERHRLRLRQGK